MLDFDLITILKERGILDAIADNVVYSCMGGSHISGTNDETSDIDVRAVTVLTQSYYTGVDKFDHTKSLRNTDGFNQYNDVDIELFGLHHFLREIYHGEIIPFEMLFVGAENRQPVPPVLKKLFESRDTFITKKVLTKYMRFVHKYHQKASLKGVTNLNRTDRINRVTLYGFETKYAMNVLKTCQMVLEILNGDGVNLYRHNKDYLMSVKNGALTQEEYIVIANDLIKECNERIESSTLIPERVEADLMNTLMHDTLSTFR